MCKNTVTLALQSATSSWYLRHTTNVQGKIAQAREALGIVWAYKEEFADAVDALASASFTDQEFDKFLESLIKEPKNPTDRKERRVEVVRDEMRGLWHAPTQANVKNTRWAAYNAVVEWADWMKPVRGKGMDKDVLRAERIMLGGVDSVKNRAYSLLTV